MRLVGHLRDEDAAKTFSRYLTSVNIHNLVEPDTDGWAVWIHSEDQIESGQQALAAYLKNPADKKYQMAAQAAVVIERQRERDEAKAAKRIHSRDRIWSRMNIAPLTLSLIGVSVVVTLLEGLNLGGLSDFHWLAIQDIGMGFLPEVRSGQIWRLITPIFVHFGALHLIFNMLWLNDLGAVVELRYGTLKLALFVVIVGILSNLGQYLWAGPVFGGMSGVLYGLFGFIWLRGVCDPDSRIGLPSRIVWMMMIWFFLCLFGIIENVANGTHLVGLVLGMLWGAAPMAKRLFGR